MATEEIRPRVKRHPVASFFLLAYAISWLVPGGTRFGPTLAALIVTWYSGMSVRKWARKIVRRRVALRRYVVAIGVRIVVVCVQSAIFGLARGPIFPSMVPGAVAGASGKLLCGAPTARGGKGDRNDER